MEERGYGDGFIAGDWEASQHPTSSYPKGTLPKDTTPTDKDDTADNSTAVLIIICSSLGVLIIAIMVYFIMGCKAKNKKEKHSDKTTYYQ